MSENGDKGLRLHWFSPLPPVHSGIADYTADLLPYLKEHAEVVLWTAQERWSTAIEQAAPVRRFRRGELSWMDIARSSDIAEVPVYHIGNNAKFHESILDINSTISGVTVLHDTRLQDLFVSLFRSREDGREEYCGAMRRQYGVEGENAAESFWAGERSIQAMAERFPLPLLALENSPAAIVHSPESLALLAREGYHTATSLALPYKSRCRPPERLPGPPYRIVILGYLGANRRLDSFFRALGGFAANQQFRVDVFGEVYDLPAIENIVRQVGLADLVSFKGRLPIEQVDAGLSRGHLAVNLRFPSMGEASLSQLQLWDHALPTMVTAIGWYAHLPPGTVLPVRPEHENRDIQCHLAEFLKEPERFYSMGTKAEEFLRTAHSPEKYAADLVSFATLYSAFRLRRTGLKLATRSAIDLHRWLPRHCLEMISPRITDEIASLMNAEQEHRSAVAR